MLIFIKGVYSQQPILFHFIFPFVTIRVTRLAKAFIEAGAQVVITRQREATFKNPRTPEGNPASPTRGNSQELAAPYSSSTSRTRVKYSRSYLVRTESRSVHKLRPSVRLEFFRPFKISILIPNVFGISFFTFRCHSIPLPVIIKFLKNTHLDRILDLHLYLFCTHIFTLAKEQHLSYIFTSYYLLLSNVTTILFFNCYFTSIL